MKRLPLALIIILAMFTGIVRSAPPQKPDIDEPAARIIFTQILGDSKKAQDLIDRMWLLAKNNDLDPPTVMNLSRRLLVWKWPIDDLARIVQLSADAAAAVGIESSEFAEMVLVLGEMVKDDHDDAYGSLNALDRLGLPAYDILGEMVGMRSSEVKELAIRRRIRSRPAMEALLAGFERRYNGLAAKLAQEKKKRQQ